MQSKHCFHLPFRFGQGLHENNQLRNSLNVRFDSIITRKLACFPTPLNITKMSDKINTFFLINEKYQNKKNRGDGFTPLPELNFFIYAASPATISVIYIKPSLFKFLEYAESKYKIGYSALKSLAIDTSAG